MPVTHIGNRGAVSRMVSSFNRVGRYAMRTSLQEWAAMAEMTAKEHIHSQDLPWAELSEAWMKVKQDEGWSTNIYQAVGGYLDSIVSVADVTRYTAFAGVKRGKTHPVTGESMVSIAEIMEYGFMEGGVQARPLWEPTFEETMAWFTATVDVHPSEIFARIMINKSQGLFKPKALGR